MTYEQFAYWLQGFAEISGEVPRKEEWDMIKAHLATCFNKVTPIKPEPPSSIWKREWELPSVTCRTITNGGPTSYMGGGIC